MEFDAAIRLLPYISLTEKYQIWLILQNWIIILIESILLYKITLAHGALTVIL